MLISVLLVTASLAAEITIIKSVLIYITFATIKAAAMMNLVAASEEDLVAASEEDLVAASEEDLVAASVTTLNFWTPY